MLYYNFTNEHLYIRERRCSMLTFKEFINDFPTNKCCEGSKTAEKIYEIITSDKNRIKMSYYADVGITPLTAVVDDIIQITQETNSDYKLDRKVQRQTVGRMVGAALKDLGYVPLSRARVLSNLKTNPFTTAVTYQHTDEGTEEVYSIIRRKKV